MRLGSRGKDILHAKGRWVPMVDSRGQESKNTAHLSISRLLHGHKVQITHHPQQEDWQGLLGQRIKAL